MKHTTMEHGSVIRKETGNNDSIQLEAELLKQQTKNNNQLQLVAALWQQQQEWQ